MLSIQQFEQLSTKNIRHLQELIHKIKTQKDPLIQYKFQQFQQTRHQKTFQQTKVEQQKFSIKEKRSFQRFRLINEPKTELTHLQFFQEQDNFVSCEKDLILILELNDQNIWRIEESIQLNPVQIINFLLSPNDEIIYGQDNRSLKFFELVRSSQHTSFQFNLSQFSDKLTFAENKEFDINSLKQGQMVLNLENLTLEYNKLVFCDQSASITIMILKLFKLMKQLKILTCQKRFFNLHRIIIANIRKFTILNLLFQTYILLNSQMGTKYINRPIFQGCLQQKHQRLLVQLQY